MSLSCYKVRVINPKELKTKTKLIMGIVKKTEANLCCKQQQQQHVRP